jgi:UDP-N-acetylglucosamine 3-dehydrogenase
VPNKKIKVCVIGAGNMGKYHLRNYDRLPEANLVGMADVNPESIELAKQYKIKHYSDFKKMLDELKPEAVSIAVPTPYHFAVAYEVLSRGINCLLEKPIASTVEEADKLINLAKKKKLVFTIGHIEQYNPLITKLKDMINHNSLGEVSSVICKRVGGFPAVEPKTDVIIDLAVHDIDLISFLLNKNPSNISSHGSRTHHSHKIDSAEILLDYGDASGFIQANWITPVKIRTIAITGSNGYIEGNYITQELEYYKHNLPKKVGNNFSTFVNRVGEPEKEIIKVKFSEPLYIELHNFLSRINNNNQVHLVDPINARNALELALKAAEGYE